MNSHEPDNLINEARLLMPWYLTNKLSAEEQDLVNKALEQSEALRKEFLTEEKMMSLVKENSSLLELSALDTTEQRLANTLARIDQEDMRQAVADKVLVSDQQHRNREQSSTSNWLGKLFSTPLLDFSWLSPANAVFAALLVFQVGVLGYMQLTGPEAQTQYTSASVAPAETVTGQQKMLLLMEFEDDARYGAVCDFLNDWDARIVDGPDGMNMFSVEMSTDTAEDTDKLLEAIRQQAAQAKVPVSFIGPKYQN